MRSQSFAVLCIIGVSACQVQPQQPIEQQPLEGLPNEVVTDDALFWTYRCVLSTERDVSLGVRRGTGSVRHVIIAAPGPSEENFERKLTT